MKHVALSILVSLMLISLAFRFELTKGDPVKIVVPDDSYTGPALWWNKTYGGAGSDFAVDLVHTTDGGYALVGSTGSFGAGDTDVWLVKTDALGNHLWNKTYGGTGADYANALVQTTDGGYAFVGYYSSGVSKDAWLVVADASGNHLWNRTYGGVGEDRGYALVQTIDGGYALACSTSSFGAGSNDFWLVKTSADGSHEWNKTYGGTGMEDPLALIQTADGGYALTGRTSSFGAGSTDFWLVKTDASGSHLWNRTYGGVNVERAYSLVQTTDGGYALVGPTYSFGAGNGDVWLVKTDASGYNLWNRTYGGPYVDWVYSVIETSDCGYAFTGPTYSYGAGSSDVWLVKTDALGNAEWNQTYGGTGEDYAGSLIQTSDGGYAIAGGTKSFGAGSDDFLLVRTVRDITTITVPDDYPTIQEAINNAVDGDTVFVKAGTYYEHVVVNKRLCLTGESRTTTIIDGNKTGPVILVAANGVDLADFTIRAGQNSHPITNVLLESASECSIRHNILIDGFYGVYLNESNDNAVYRNLATNVSTGVCGFRSDWNCVYSNEFVANSFAGINFHLCSFNNVTENLIASNSAGIRFLDGANNNTVYHNNFVNNTIQTYVKSSYSNIWDNGYPSGGNYWSDYTGSDCRNGPSQNLAGCDGIGDTPNVIDSSNRDNYPLMKPIPWDSDDIGVTCFGKVGSQGASSMKTVIAEGTTVHFNVFVMNYGNDAEVFNITVYVNATLLGAQTEVAIIGRGFAIVSFTWNTSSFERGSYTIDAQITAVPDETDTIDNSFVCLVTIGTIGDVDNNGIVNMSDVYDIALDFGAIVGQTSYVSNCDIDDNGIVNMLDLYVTATHYGQTHALFESTLNQRPVLADIR